MNKEQQQIIDESFGEYSIMVWRITNIPVYSKEEFINKCRTDQKFSEQWGLKIEERELSLKERTKILVSRSEHKKVFYDRNGRLIVEEHTLVLDESNIPTKLITVTYNNTKIESYE
jgi:hypothetical protein